MGFSNLNHHMNWNFSVPIQKIDKINIIVLHWSSWNVSDWMPVVSQYVS